MEFYCFKAKDVGNDVEKRIIKVNEDDDEYISYNNYLKSEYSTNIQENGRVNNEDFIAQLIGNSAIMILERGYFKFSESDEVFEILVDKLGERHEKDNNCEWLSAGR